MRWDTLRILQPRLKNGLKRMNDRLKLILIILAYALQHASLYARYSLHLHILLHQRNSYLIYKKKKNTARVFFFFWQRYKDSNLK